MALSAVSISACTSLPEHGELIPDYRNGKPNALVCPDNASCFQCDHQTAKRYEKLYDQNKWHGDIWFLPLDMEP